MSGWACVTENWAAGMKQSKAYTRSLDLDLDSADTAGRVCDLFEAFVIAERPEELLHFVQTLDKKRWELPKEGRQAPKYPARRL